MKFHHAKQKLMEMDLKGCVVLNHLSHSGRVAVFFKIISRLGNGVFWYVMIIATWALQGLLYSLQMLYLILGSTVGTAIYKVLKTKTVRPRPYQVHQLIRLGDHPLDYYSFPSGHTLHAVMATTMLGYAVPVLLILMLPFTVLVAASRMILGLHYPSDVAMGAVIGITVAVSFISLAPLLNIVL
ncbi:phosphatase PAP2 family protein [Acinetobacter schindleri]|uniref:phosphatase PAP2 family protein n=1 Tax=Acinetobacter TaxID=469 RepID=UPI0006629EC4|nr:MULTISPECIES: phosphatase PAP2 family protein [Acinetobacter]APX61956.1 phosphatidic acid phosphatase protein [Acinetobacter schindleri]KMV00283.1 phosphatidylglycerophosphatase [Acinetobacter sp. VT 511]OIJ38284.1 phosphatidylglycerophosphatase [Acinetobacter sp. LCT-H3]PUR00714.1 PAP2 family protein [Acinetobacter schindleri]RAZ04005.1 PAP2 family protein [Acinetobacter sp. SM1B]